MRRIPGHVLLRTEVFGFLHHVVRAACVSRARLAHIYTYNDETYIRGLIPRTGS